MGRFDTAPLISTHDVHARFDGVEPGQSSGTRVTVLGTVTARRRAGSLLFLDLYDRSGRIQLLAGSFTDNLENLGEVAGELEVSGVVIRTKTGELTVRVLLWRQS